MTEKGFTLFEILVVMAITAIIGMMMVMIFANTLRGSNKSQMLGVIKQNGQAVLDNMDKTIRNADNVVCISTSGNTVAIVKDGIYIRYRVAVSDNNPPDPLGSAPADCILPGRNGCVIFDNPVKQTVPATGELETDTAFINRICNPADLMNTAAILTDTNIQSGVKILAVKDALGNDLPFFQKNTSAGFKDSITIQFSLMPGAAVSEVLTSQINPVSFRTTIQLR